MSEFYCVAAGATTTSALLCFRLLINALLRSFNPSVVSDSPIASPTCHTRLQLRRDPGRRRLAWPAPHLCVACAWHVILQPGQADQGLCSYGVAGKGRWRHLCLDRHSLPQAHEQPRCGAGAGYFPDFGLPTPPAPALQSAIVPTWRIAAGMCSQNEYQMATRNLREAKREMQTPALARAVWGVHGA